jgi:hypothetical protein
LIENTSQHRKPEHSQHFGDQFGFHTEMVLFHQFAAAAPKLYLCTRQLLENVTTMRRELTIR